MNALAPDDPPPDAGAGAFIASFLALPIALAALVVLKSDGHRGKSLGALAAIFAGFVIVSVWAYLSRSRVAVAIKSAIGGAAVVMVFVAYLAAVTELPKGDDVAPLILVVLGPIAVVGGGALALVSALVALGVMALRQRPRVAWLRRVREGAHPRYRVGPMTPGDAKAPPFLRYRDGVLALRSWGTGDYRESPQGDTVARVPW